MGMLFNAGGQTGKDCLLTRVDGVKVADRLDWTQNVNLSLWKRSTNCLQHRTPQKKKTHWPQWSARSEIILRTSNSAMMLFTYECTQQLFTRLSRIVSLPNLICFFFSLMFHFSGKLTPGFTVEVVTEPYVLKGKLEGHIYFKPETYRMWAIEPETEVTVSLFPENKIDRPYEINFPVSKEDIIMRRKLIVLSHIGFPNLANTTEAYILVIGVQKIQLRLKTWRLGKFLKNWHCRWRWNVFTLKRNFCCASLRVRDFPFLTPPPFNRMRVRWKKVIRPVQKNWE